MRIFWFLMLTLASPLAAEGYERPLPQPQSATAELWFGLASLALFISLYAVHRIVAARK